VYEFKNHKIKEFIGGIYDFLQKRKLENLSELERKTKTGNEPAAKEATIIKQDYLEKKELDKVIRKLSQQITTAEQKIEWLEKEIQEINGLLSDPAKIEKGSEAKLYVRHGEVEKLLKEEMSIWEKLNVELEELKKQRF
jgi:ATP-binding cassette subfamily F protein 3